MHSDLLQHYPILLEHILILLEYGSILVSDGHVIPIYRWAENLSVNWNDQIKMILVMATGITIIIYRVLILLKEMNGQMAWHFIGSP